MRQTILLIAAMALVGCGKKPDEAANVLFVEATKLVSQAKAKESTDYKAAIADYEKALELIQKITDKYPETDLAVKLVSNETVFTGQTLAQIKARMAQLVNMAEETAAQAKAERERLAQAKAERERLAQRLAQAEAGSGLSKKQILYWGKYASSGKWNSLKLVDRRLLESGLQNVTVKSTTIAHPFLGEFCQQKKVYFKCSGDLVEITKFLKVFAGGEFVFKLDGSPLEESHSLIRISDFKIAPSADRRRLWFDFTIVAPIPDQANRLFPAGNKVTWLLKRRPGQFLNTLKAFSMFPEEAVLNSLKYLCEPNESYVLLQVKGTKNALEKYTESLAKNILFSKVTSKRQGGRNEWQIKVILK